MSLPDVEVRFDDDVEPPDTDIGALAHLCIGAAMKHAGINPEEGSEVSILIANDTVLRALNRKWRNRDRPTNVLSFPGEPEGLLLGDIVLSLETVQREAVLENKRFDDHLSHLIVHGFLHLFGYDHETDEEARIMEGLETRILNEIDIEDPHEEQQAS